MIKERSKEITPSIDKKTFIISTVFPILALLIINFCFIFILKKFNPNRGLEVISNKWKLAQSITENPEWLVIGDSSGNQCFNNRVFDSIMNTNSLNLCTIGDMILFDDLWFLEYFESVDKLPQNILMIHSFDVFQREMIFESGYQQIPKLNFKSKMEVPFQFNIFAKYFPLVYRISSIKHLLLSPKKCINKNYSFTEKGQLIIYENNPMKIGKDLDKHLSVIREKKDYTMFENNIKALKHIAQLAAKHDINFYFADPGLYDGLIEDENFKPYYAQFKSKIRSLTKQLGIRYLDNGPDGYPIQEMEQTVDHIIYPASIEYTTKVAVALSQKFAN